MLELEACHMGELDRLGQGKFVSLKEHDGNLLS